MTDFAPSPTPLNTSSPSSAAVHSDSSPRPSLIPLVSFSTSSPTTTHNSTRTFFPSAYPPPSFKQPHRGRKAPLTPIPARVLPSVVGRENDASQVNRPPPPTRLIASPSTKQRDERTEALRLLCQRPIGEPRGERRVGGRSDKQYGDDMLILGQLPALIESGQLAGTMDRVFRLIADSIENPRSKQASTALALLPSLLSSNVQAATASVSAVLSSLLHCYLHGEKFLQRDVPPLLQQCMALSGGRTIGVFGAKERGGSKNARERAICACVLHTILSVCTASTFTAYDGCSTCPSALPSTTASAFNLSTLPLAELTTVLSTLHTFVSDGQASTRYHARHAITHLCSHASPAVLDVALKALPFEHAAAIRAIAPSPSPTLSPTSSPLSATRPRHHTMPSPPLPPSASPPRMYATLPDEREWEEWKQQPGLVSPVKCDTLPDADTDANVMTPQADERGQDEDDEVVVRVHTTRGAVSPVPFAGSVGDEDEDEISVVVAVGATRPAVSDTYADTSAAYSEAPVVVTVVQSASELQIHAGQGSAQLDKDATVAAVESQAMEQGQHTTKLDTIGLRLSFTPARSSTEGTRLSTKRKRSDSPAPADREAASDQPLHITSATQWLQRCREAEASGSHKQVVELSTAAIEWLSKTRQAADDKQATDRCVAAAERQMSRMAAMMERVKASVDKLRRSMRIEAVEEEMP